MVGFNTISDCRARFAAPSIRLIRHFFPRNEKEPPSRKAQNYQIVRTISGFSKKKRSLNDRIKGIFIMWPRLMFLIQSRKGFAFLNDQILFLLNLPKTSFLIFCFLPRNASSLRDKCPRSSLYAMFSRTQSRSATCMKTSSDCPVLSKETRS